VLRAVKWMIDTLLVQRHNSQVAYVYILLPRCPTPTPDFVIDEDWCRNVPALAFGDGSTPEALQFWYDTWRTLYSGDEGRKKARSAVSCLVERDGLLPRLPDVKCPVHWLHVSFARLVLSYFAGKTCPGT
jgi:hypothetical protein